MKQKKFDEKLKKFSKIPKKNLFLQLFSEFSIQSIFLEYCRNVGHFVEQCTTRITQINFVWHEHHNRLEKCKKEMHCHDCENFLMIYWIFDHYNDYGVTDIFWTFG